jgi:hypothetical protein
MQPMFDPTVPALLFGVEREDVPCGAFTVGVTEVCPAKTCADQGFACGWQGDGCGNPIDCGACPPGWTCAGTGPASCTSGTCMPKSCAELGLACGGWGDGCGNPIDCGSCPVGLACGGGGIPGMCG